MSYTTKELKQLGDLIEQKIKYNNQILRKEFKTDLKIELDVQRDKIVAYFKAEIEFINIKIDKLKEGFKLKFEELRIDIKKLERKIDDIIKMETEDIKMLWDEIEEAKTQILVLEKSKA